MKKSYIALAAAGAGLVLFESRTTAVDSNTPPMPVAMLSAAKASGGGGGGGGGGAAPALSPARALPIAAVAATKVRANADMPAPRLVLLSRADAVIEADPAVGGGPVAPADDADQRAEAAAIAALRADAARPAFTLMKAPAAAPVFDAAGDVAVGGGFAVARPAAPAPAGSGTLAPADPIIVVGDVPVESDPILVVSAGASPTDPVLVADNVLPPGNGFAPAPPLGAFGVADSVPTGADSLAGMAGPTASAVPDTATWLSLVAGLALVGFNMRSRQTPSATS